MSRGPAIGFPFHVFAAGLCALTGLTAWPGVAGAYEFVLNSRTIGQGYQERRYAETGSTELLSRRRLTQYLNLSLFNIEPEGWRGADGDRNQISVELGVRFDSDFGRFMQDRPRGLDAIGELAQSQIDILYAYALARDLGGWLDLQLGRQVHYDLVDFYSYDGGNALAHVGRFVSVEAFGGTEVRGELPLSAPLYEIDGTSVGSRDPATRPEQQRALRPMVGAALAMDRLTFVSARVAYRQTSSTTVEPRPGDPEQGLNHQAVSATFDGRWRDRAFVTAAARYNLLVALWDDQQAALRVRLGQRHLVGLEYSYLAPTFDGDSIWNVFGAGAFRDYRASWDVTLAADWRVHARGFLRQFVESDQTSTDWRALAAQATGGTWATGFNAGADVRGTRGQARSDVYIEAGYGGRKLGWDASGRWTVTPQELDVEGRLTMYGWRADNTPVTVTAWMVGAQAGLRYQMSRKMRLHFLGENNSGNTYRAQVRGLAVLEVDVSL